MAIAATDEFRVVAERSAARQASLAAISFAARAYATGSVAADICASALGIVTAFRLDGHTIATDIDLRVVTDVFPFAARPACLATKAIAAVTLAAFAVAARSVATIGVCTAFRLDDGVVTADVDVWVDTKASAARPVGLAAVVVAACVVTAGIAAAGLIGRAV